MKQNREHWSSRLGIILAVAGSAVGLGNFLRFPAKAALYGGGAFMIPYFIALFLLGIPLMWVEWTLGRMGGVAGHGTAPAIFQSIAPKNKWIKYIGVIGVMGPLVIFIYYTFIESWTLAYSFFALTKKYGRDIDYAGMKHFLSGFQGLETNQYFDGFGWAYLFFLITFAINIWVIYHGIKGGIEKLCNWAMPILFICAAALVLRVLTMPPLNPDNPDWNAVNGLGYLWNPDFSALKSARVWLEAAGQIFFTLSVGIGCILTYASYLTKKDDVALSGLTAAGTNEFAEVILGGSIIIPAAFMLFGPIQMQEIAGSGVFNLGFVTMPLVLNQVPMSDILSFIWFFLLFLAGVTSSVSLAQPAVAFLEDEFDMKREKAVMVFAFVTFFLCQPAIFFLKNGVVDELDFWGGSFFLVLFAAVEIIIFGWVLGIDKGWDELHQGAALKVPKFYKFIIKYVTPLFLLTILSVWVWQEWLPTILMKNVPPENFGYVLGTRLGLVAMFVLLCAAVNIAWKRKKR